MFHIKVNWDPLGVGWKGTVMFVYHGAGFGNGTKIVEVHFWWVCLSIVVSGSIPSGNLAGFSTGGMRGLSFFSCWYKSKLIADFSTPMTITVPGMSIPWSCMPFLILGQYGPRSMTHRNDSWIRFWVRVGGWIIFQVGSRLSVVPRAWHSLV